MTPTPLAYILVVLACLPVLVQRQRPLWAFGLTSGVTLLYLGLGYAYGPILITLGVVILAAALRLPLRATLVAMAVLLAAAGLVIGAGVWSGTHDATEFIGMAAWLVIPAAVGITIKTRQEAAAAVRDEQARRAVSEERLRLAQEVHDVAGHGFSVIAMQAGVALRVFDRDPDGARSAVEHIRAASREALDNLRAEVEALREDVPLRPTSGLADLTALADRIRSTGLSVTVTSDVDTLPADVDRVAYRILQESLTNVLRHAGPDATATVVLTLRGDVLHMSVADTGRGVNSLREGRGIDGMRARAESLGGTLDAGPVAAGGFVVRAALPIGGAR